MLKLGKIYYADDLVNHTQVDYIDYVHKKDLAITKDVFKSFETPTLIVGWNLLKEMITISEDLDIKTGITILNKRIVSKALYWEYAYSENKHYHISGVTEFVNQVPDHYFTTRYSYINVDPVFFSIESIDELMNYLPKEGYKVYNYKNEMLYILYDNKISGIDLKLYSYFDFDVATIISKLKEKADEFTSDADGSIYSSYYGTFPQFENLKRYLIVFLSNR